MFLTVIMYTHQPFRFKNQDYFNLWEKIVSCQMYPWLRRVASAIGPSKHLLSSTGPYFVKKIINISSASGPPAGYFLNILLHKFGLLISLNTLRVNPTLQNIFSPAAGCSSPTEHLGPLSCISSLSGPLTGVSLAPKYSDLQTWILSHPETTRKLWD